MDGLRGRSLSLLGSIRGKKPKDKEKEKEVPKEPADHEPPGQDSSSSAAPTPGTNHATSSKGSRASVVGTSVAALTRFKSVTTRALKAGAIKNGLVTDNEANLETWESIVTAEILEKVTGDDRKRQEALYEIISTERKYLKKCKVVIEKYVGPMKALKIVEPAVHACIFSEIEAVYAKGQIFYAKLEQRQKDDEFVIQKISDLFEELIPDLTPCKIYCGNMRNASKCLAHYLEKDEGLVAFLEKTHSDPEVAEYNGFDLSTFLLEPMQRLTRYPLLVRQVLRFTARTHPDYHNLHAALDSLEGVVVQTNEAAKAKDNSVHLKKLQTVFNLSELEEELVLDGVTRALGSREILHRGFLFMSKGSSMKKVMTFLFNDILLFAIPHPKPNPKNFLYAPLRAPLAVNDLLIRSSHALTLEDEEFQLVFRTEVIELKAPSVAEREKWVVVLDTAINNYFSVEQQKQKAKIKKFSKISGHLEILVVKGINLVSRDTNGLSDPFCILELLDEQRDTNCLEKTLNPVWEQQLSFAVVEKPLGAKLTIRVLDRDQYSSDDPMGECHVDLSVLKDIPDGEEREFKLKLENVESGEIVIKICYRVADF